MANVYGSDGSALSMTLTTPHAPRHDVRRKSIIEHELSVRDNHTTGAARFMDNGLLIQEHLETAPIDRIPKGSSVVTLLQAIDRHVSTTTQRMQMEVTAKNSLRLWDTLLGVQQNQLQSFRLAYEGFTIVDGGAALAITFESPVEAERETVDFCFIDNQEYAAAQRRAAEVPRLEAEIARRQQKIRNAEEQKRTSRTREELAQATSEINELTIELAQLRAQVDELVRSAPRTEVLSMVEHRPRLLQALKDAKQRIIIVSPWLTRKAVNWELREAIGAALARGVRVIIGYGFEKEPDREEKQTVEKLEQLQHSPAAPRAWRC